MPFLKNFVIRVIVAAILVMISLAIHYELGPRNPIGMAAIYFIFVGYAWAGALWDKPLLGKAFLFALPDLFIPPIILLPLKNTLDDIQISILIGIVMSVYSAYMVGWMMNAYDKAHPSATPAAA
ncbi:MAG: hypothetical protein ABI743_09820 [bacterium]